MATIQDLIDAAAPGQTITVPTTLTTSPGFTPKTGLTINGHPALTITSEINGASVARVTIRNMKILNAGSGTAANPYGGEALRTGPGWTVEDVDVIDAKGFGIRPYGDGCTFRRVRAIRCALGGWWIGNEDPNGPGTKNQLLENCSAIDCGRGAGGWHAVGGIKFYKTTGCTLDGGTWSGCTFPNVWIDWENKNCTIRNAYIHDSKPCIWQAGLALECNGTSVTVENCYIADNAGGGVAFWENPGAVIQNNNFVRDGLEWRNDPGRGHTSTGNRLLSNKTYSCSLAPFAGNTISGTVTLASEPPKPGATPPTITYTDIGGGWKLGSNKRLYLNGEWDGQSEGVTEARWGLTTVIQKNGAGTIYEFVGPFKAVTQWAKRTTWPAAADPRVADLEKQLADMTAHADLLETGITNRDAALLSAQGMIKDRDGKIAELQGKIDKAKAALG